MPSVLLVEDEPAIADTLIYALETENFSVTHVSTAQAGLDHFENHAPDFAVLDIGADDYVTKPFSPRTVVARIRAILRRGKAAPKAKSSLLHHDSETMSITCCNHHLDLTAHEYKLLAILLGQPGRVFTREQLLEQAWEDPGSAMDRTIDTHIKSLRAKLRQHSEDAAETIQTRRGLGYTLVL